MRSKCQLIEGVAHGRGNKVSHSNIKTHRMFKVNLHAVRLYSYELNQYFNVRVRTRTLRTVDKYGGLDAFLVGYRKRGLTPYAMGLRKKLIKRGVVTPSS